jgi:hypothetical protein
MTPALSNKCYLCQVQSDTLKMTTINLSLTIKNNQA